ncbi:hypothetical protein EPYR_00682 [Erwinia pyrifoliae DSM 12163]|nr:hypothetical protein EPYR_00682 [Erwinia pyrifoliae DSM 12163]
MIKKLKFSLAFIFCLSVNAFAYQYNDLKIFNTHS